MNNNKNNNCKVCFEKIAINAKKCKHCGSFQDWRQYLQSTFVFAILNIIFAIAMLMVAQNAFRLQNEIDTRQRAILNAKRFDIAVQVREHVTEYINQTCKYLAYETNRVLLIDPRKAEGELENFSVDIKVIGESLEACSVLGFDFFEDIRGDSVLNCLTQARPFTVEGVGVLNEKEYFDFKQLKEDMAQCISEVKYKVQRLNRSHKFINKLFAKHYAEEGMDDVQEYDLRKNELHLSEINTIRRKIQQLKGSADRFLKHFEAIEVDSLRFILQIRSEPAFSKQDMMFGGKPSPKTYATISFDSTYYEFDYYKYYFGKLDSIVYSDTTDLDSKGGSISFLKLN